MSLEAPSHSQAFRFRRFLNWFPLGLAYAFLYMGRYNLTVAKNALGDLMTKADFGTIFGVGALVYGLAFIVNGPLTDRLGGRRTMLIGMAGSIVMNIGMGFTLLAVVQNGASLPLRDLFVLLYAANMYFQSFGAVAIVTVKAPWFHVRERGTFSTIFGVMISLGVYFAFDWGRAIVDATRKVAPEQLGPLAGFVRGMLGIDGSQMDATWWVFFIPAILLTILWLILFAFLRDRPEQAGFKDFDTGEASVSHDGERLPIKTVFLKIITHPVLSIICLIEFCSGILRNGIMHWYTFFATETGFSRSFWVTQNWGLSLLIAGIAGSFLTGWASDRFFQSRRGPMAALLYGLMLGCTLLMCFTLGANHWYLGASAMLISMSVIGVHGILSGTSTADFGGTKNTGAAVGVVDGLVYLGTAIQSFAAGRMTPTGDAAKDPSNWLGWPLFLVPFALLGLILSMRIWSALPRRGAHKSPAPAATPAANLAPAAES